MRHSLFSCLLAVMTFVLTAWSMQSPEADLSAVDANTESVSNNTTQPRVSNELDKLPPKGEKPAQMPTLMLSIDGAPVTVLWEDNETVSELLTAAQNGAIEVSASRYGGFEQVGSLPQSFSRNDVQTTTQPGDIVLYSGNQLVIFFGSNSWSYTRLGHVNGMSSEELSDLLNKDVVMIELSAE